MLHRHISNLMPIRARSKNLKEFVMSNDDGAEGLQRLRQKSTKFALKASALNKAIIAIEDHLKHLDGKVHADVHFEGGALSFKRSGNDWFLVYSQEVGFNEFEETIVRNADIPTKARAARFLPRLVELIETRHDELLENLDHGLEALGTIPWLTSEFEASDVDHSDLFDDEVSE